MLNVHVLVQVTRKVEFSLGGSLSSNLNGFSLANESVTVSIGFKSTETQGVILQDSEQVSPHVYFEI